MCSKEFTQGSLEELSSLLKNTHGVMLRIAGDEGGCKGIRYAIVELMSPMNETLITLLENLTSTLDREEDKIEFSNKLLADLKSTMRDADELLDQKDTGSFMEYLFETLGKDDTVQN